MAFIYAISTAAAIAAPFVMTMLDTAKRRAMPVNSEQTLETPPLVHPMASDETGQAVRPACIARDGTTFYSDRHDVLIGDGSGAKRTFVADLEQDNFHSCAVMDDDTVYILVHKGNLTWLRS